MDISILNEQSACGFARGLTSMRALLQPPQEIAFSFDLWLSANLNFGEPDEHDIYRNRRLARQRSVIICKHWLKGLCKKGDACEFLHEYNVRKMPECWFFNKHGYCQIVEECLYRHIDPVSRIGVCDCYERGFCPLGPDCIKRHVKGKRICQMFLTGFCPLGKECHDAHSNYEESSELQELKLQE
jgi:cleavage and polyadenylation specificity factor subunit 4